MIVTPATEVSIKSVNCFMRYFMNRQKHTETNKNVIIRLCFSMESNNKWICLRLFFFSFRHA